MEKRVYLIDNREFRHPFTDVKKETQSWTDDDFIKEAEYQGNVFTLDGFIDTYNSGSMPPFDCVATRIIDVPFENIPDVCETIQTVGDLKAFLSTLGDDDCVCMETIDLETGDVQDLFPFHLDVIDGIEMEDGRFIREVRFVQRSQDEWIDPLKNMEKIVEYNKEVHECTYMKDDDLATIDESEIDDYLKWYEKQRRI